jgi:hypothetical protein
MKIARRTGLLPAVETRFPHIPGDIGHVATWPFQVIYKVVRGATGERVTALGRSCAGAGGGGVFSREHCGQALVRHPDEGVHLAKFPGKLAPGIARIGAAEDLTVDATGQQKIGVGSVRGQVPDRAVGG